MATSLSPLKISDNQRFLVRDDGIPFFYLGDTCWLLFHRTTREEADLYLEDRATKRFNVIQACLMGALAPRHGEAGGLGPNKYGEAIFHDGDPAQPNENFFEHVDYIVDKAERLGLYLCLLPTWGHIYISGVMGPRVFHPANARSFGEWLGRRYQSRNHILWALGGDTLPNWQDEDLRPVYRAMAEGLRAGHGGRHLMTYHPRGHGYTSSTWFHDEPWLDFNMMQTGPTRNYPNYKVIAGDYAKSPPKPCFDGEPGYERSHPEVDPTQPRLDGHEIRKYAYWAVFSGAMGHTYGCLEVWQMWTPAYPPASWAAIPWMEALDLPGAFQMQHLRRLVESRPYLTRIPDDAIVAEGQDFLVQLQGLSATKGLKEHEGSHIAATRDSDGSYAFVYIPIGQPVVIRMDAISGPKAKAWWFDPRQGTATSIGEFPTTGVQRFTPPTLGFGCDWVLVLDDAARGFPAPGTGQVAR